MSLAGGWRDVGVVLGGTLDDSVHGTIAAAVAESAAWLMHREQQNSDGRQRHLAVGMANSAPFSVLCGQRCMIDFCFV